jgi:hypothetical protein
MKQSVILFILLLCLPFTVEGEEPKIRVFSTGYRGLLPINRIILKDFGRHKTCYRDYCFGRWEEKGDSLYLKLDYEFNKGKISSVYTYKQQETYQKFVIRKDSIHDCTEYEVDTMVIDYGAMGYDTIFFGKKEVRDAFAHFNELKYAPPPMKYSGKAGYSRVNILYPEKGSGVLLMMFYSQRYFFEHYFPEHDESLIGFFKSKKNKITLYPMYIQRFDKDGGLIYEKVSKTKKITFRSKDYILKRTGSTDYPFSKKYNRQKMVSSEI